MAKIIENKKGFKIIEVSLEEIQQKFGGFGICDSCNENLTTSLYIPVLDSCYCQKCYDEWYERAIRYKSDVPFENKVFELRKKQLDL